MLIRFFLLKKSPTWGKMRLPSVIPNFQFLNFILTQLHKTGNSHFLFECNNFSPRTCILKIDTFCSFQRFVTLAQASVSVTVSVQVPSQVLCFIKPLSLTLLWFRSIKLVLLGTVKRPIQIWNSFSYCCRRAVGLFFSFLLGPIFGMDILYANMTYKCGNIPSELLWWYSLPWAKWSCPFYGGASLLSSLSRDFPHNH